MMAGTSDSAARNLASDGDSCSDEFISRMTEFELIDAFGRKMDQVAEIPNTRNKVVLDLAKGMSSDLIKGNRAATADLYRRLENRYNALLSTIMRITRKD